MRKKKIPVRFLRFDKTEDNRPCVLIAPACPLTLNDGDVLEISIEGSFGNPSCFGNIPGYGNVLRS